MAASVGVNHLSIVSADTSGVTIAFPDVCKTPAPVLQGPVVAIGKGPGKGKCLVCEKDL